MCRAPRRCAPFTCTSACCSASSTTIGSGSVASPSAKARNARSTALTATAKEILSRNASSGTTRISVDEHALQAALRLGQRLLEVVQLLAEAEADVIGQTEMIAWHQQHAVLGAHLFDELEARNRLAVLHQADGAGLGRMPGEGVPEALEPGLEHGVVRLEDAPRALEQLIAHSGLERDGGEMVARARGADGGVVVPRPRLRRERRRRGDPADPPPGQAGCLGEAVHCAAPIGGGPESRRWS